MSQRDQNSEWEESDIIVNQLMEIARISALAEMASGIAHEVNQPLGAIATFAQAGERLLDRPEPLTQRALEVFRQISAEAMGAGEGIRRIRRAFDHHEPKPTPCQMGELIEELRPVLGMLAARYRAQLDIRVTPGLPELLVERLRVQHVLFALVQNAFEACQNCDIRRVGIEARADRYCVETSVIDSGSGITAATQERLFHPFFTTKPQGTGLGLASARAIIEAHEGTIGFDAVPTGGSRFWFRLPFSQ